MVWLGSSRTWDLEKTWEGLVLWPQSIAPRGQGLVALFSPVFLVPKTTLRLVGAQEIGMEQSCWRIGPVEQQY